jgi:Uma2 family endonuclease
MATDAVSYDPAAAISPELQPVVDDLVTEDDTPLDNVFQEKQQSLLTRTLHSSWPGPGERGTFVAMANVGFYYSTHDPAIVPDVLVSLNVALPADVWPKRARSYCSWEYGKAPEVVVEIVSNREGGEDSGKMSVYAVAGVRYYVIFDPQQYLSDELVRAFRLRGLHFEALAEPFSFLDVGLGLRLWHGRYEDLDATWLRWVDARDTLIPTADERAGRLAEKLRQLGVDPQAE